MHSTPILGLVSISFRKLSCAEVLAAMQRAELSSIEWGGDVHVPHGVTDKATEVAQMTRDAGIEIACYGSYYRLSESEPEGLSFDQVLDSALHLGAPMIRVWAGRRNAEDADADYWQKVVDDVRRVAAKCRPHQIQIALEYHGNSLTNSAQSTARLLHELPEDNISTLWQPIIGRSAPENQADLAALESRVSNLHCFYWNDSRERRRLAEGESQWVGYLRALRSPKRRHILLEFVQNDDPSILPQESAALRRFVELARLNPARPE